MKNVFLICLILVILISTAAFSFKEPYNKDFKEKNYIALDKLPKEYNFDMALANGDIVPFTNKDYNSEKFLRFYEAYENKKLKNGDMIRITKYSVEGYAYIEDLIYRNGKLTLIADNTRNEYANPKHRVIEEYKIVDIYTEKNMYRLAYIGKTEKGEEVVIISLLEK